MWNGYQWSVTFKEQEDETAAAIAVFANGEEMAMAGLLHGDVKAKLDIRCRPPAAAKSGGKTVSKYEVATAEHPFFGTMKVTSKTDATKLRFACITSTERKFISQVSSQMVPDIDTGHRVMKALMAAMVEKPDITEKKDVYKLRDEMLEKIKETSQNEGKDSKDIGSKKDTKGANDEKEKGKKKDSHHDNKDKHKKVIRDEDEDIDKKDTKHDKAAGENKKEKKTKPEKKNIKDEDEDEDTGKKDTKHGKTTGGNKKEKKEKPEKQNIKDENKDIYSDIQDS